MLSLNFEDDLYEGFAFSGLVAGTFLGHMIRQTGELVTFASPPQPFLG